MKKILAVVVIVMAVALMSAGVAMAGVSGTKHDLSSTLTRSYQFSTTEVCVFCHTPHNAGGLQPLWNRSAGTGVFTAYGTTQAGNNISGSASNITTLCLSCHDGTQALNVLWNFPGSATSLAIVSGSANLSGSYAKIDADLRNDHPVGIQYALGTAAAGLNVLSAGTNIVAKVTGSNPGNVQGSATATVECSSCHNPHDNTQGSFLRASNTNSQLCLVCHIK